LTIGLDDLPSILGDIAENVSRASKLLLEAALHAESEQLAKLRQVCVKLDKAMESAGAASSEASIASLKQVGDHPLRGISNNSSQAHTARDRRMEGAAATRLQRRRVDPQRPHIPRRSRSGGTTPVRRAGARRIRVHDARHTAATLALRAGVHVKVVTQRLGHPDVSVTMSIYST
jgi:hypothetical protein